MLPVIAIIGRPNVGKSTLFNRLTKSRDALVADLPGLTRDRKYGEGVFNKQRFIIVDTGGIGIDEQEEMNSLVVQQTRQALQEADAVLFVVDGRAGRTAADEVIAAQIRSAKKTIYLVVNKTEGINPDLAMIEFHALGIGQPIAISATHGEAVNSLMTEVLKDLKHLKQDEPEDIAATGIKVAIIGRPNVGKSTLVNRILGEDRVVVFDQAGTTRDSIFIPFERREQKYTIIDTAGVRRRGKISETIEKFSVIKALQAIDTANVVIFVVDAREGIVEHDLHLLGFVLDAGRSLVIAINKWDGLDEEVKKRIKSELQRRLQFVDFAKIHMISALHGTGVGDLFGSINRAYTSATKKFSTNFVSKILEKAVAKFAPPLVKGRRVKLRYAHMGGHNPPTIIIHGNQTDALPMNYKRYLEKFYRNELRLIGTPIRLQFKTGENPFADKKNPLTERQQKKRGRLLKYVKKK